jgi:pheromone shutdown protein TraB
MITLVGISHVLRIAEPVTFIVKNIWPDAVLVELDASRYNYIASSPEQQERMENPAFRKASEAQKRMAEEHGSQAGAEFIAAIETGKMIGAAIEFIDIDAAKMMGDAWKEMPFIERMRFRLSMLGDRLRPKKSAGRIQKRYADDEEEYSRWMRKKYPTLVRKVIDERDVHMAGKIREASEKYENIVAVIGDGHIEGITKILADESIRKIRLKTLMDKESMNALRAELWSGTKAEEKE